MKSDVVPWNLKTKDMYWYKALNGSSNRAAAFGPRAMMLSWCKGWERAEQGRACRWMAWSKEGTYVRDAMSLE